MLSKKFKNYYHSRNSVSSGLKVSKESSKNFGKHLTLVIPITAFGLCYWQYERRKWKLGLIEKLKITSLKEPIPLDEKVNCSKDLPEFTRVSVSGYFDHTRELLIGSRQLIEDRISPNGFGSELRAPTAKQLLSSRQFSNPTHNSKNGYFLVTPFFIKEQGKWILVNRGWIPYELRDPSDRLEGQVKGKIEISGIVRYHEKPPIFAPEPKYLTNRDGSNIVQFFSREIDQMSKLVNTSPILVDADYESTVKGGPIGGQTNINVRNEHLSYMITWAGVGIGSILMWLKLTFF